MPRSGVTNPLREPGPYRIVGDNSGHEYVIPTARGRHWDKWLTSEEASDGLLPIYAERIDGTFVILDYALRDAALAE